MGASLDLLEPGLLDSECEGVPLLDESSQCSGSRLALSPDAYGRRVLLGAEDRIGSRIEHPMVPRPLPGSSISRSASGRLQTFTRLSRASGRWLEICRSIGLPCRRAEEGTGEPCHGSARVPTRAASMAKAHVVGAAPIQQVYIKVSVARVPSTVPVPKTGRAVVATMSSPIVSAVVYRRAPRALHQRRKRRGHRGTGPPWSDRCGGSGHSGRGGGGV